MHKLPENWKEEAEARRIRGIKLKRPTLNIPPDTVVDAWAAEAKLMLRLLRSGLSYSQTAKVIERCSGKKAAKGVVAGRLCRLREMWQNGHGSALNYVQNEHILDNPAKARHSAESADDPKGGSSSFS